MFRRLTWARFLLRGPIVRSPRQTIALSWCSRCGSSPSNLVPYLWPEWITSVDHQRIGVHVHDPGAGHDDGARVAWCPMGLLCARNALCSTAAHRYLPTDTHDQNLFAHARS